MTFERKKYRTTTPATVKDCLDAGMNIRRTAEYMGVSLHGLRSACGVFGWSSRGRSGPKHNTVEMPVRRNSVFDVGPR